MSVAANVMSVGLSPNISMGLTYMAMSSSLAHVMNNAVTAERSSQMIQTASVTQCCALMVSIGAAGAAK